VIQLPTLAAFVGRVPVVTDGKAQVEARSGAGLRADANCASGSPHKGDDLWHAEAGAGIALGREVGIEEVFDDVRGHATTLIGDANSDPSFRRRFQITARLAPFVSRNADLAALRHRVTRIDDQI